MDGIQILIYIAVAVIYLILKGVNKGAKPLENGNPPAEANDNTPIPHPANLPPRKTGPSSFEDLLNEFGEVTHKKEKQGQEKKAEANAARKKAEQTLDNTRKKVSQRMVQPETEGGFEVREQERRERYANEEFSLEHFKPSYETKAGKINYEDPSKAIYEGLDDHKKRFAPFDIEVRPTKVINYACLLKDPKSIQTAFILGEILKRKFE